MKHFGIALLIVAAVVATAAPVLAASGVSAEAAAGIDGYVVPNRPVTIDVTVSADVPFVGTMRVMAGGILISTPVEVPAGSTKVYTVTLPTAPADASPTVKLFPEGSTEAVERIPLTLRTRGSQVLVGVYASPGTIEALDSVLSVPFSTRIVPLEVTDRDFGTNLAPLTHLILGKGAAARLQPDAIDGITRWLREGGRLVVADADVADIGSPLGDLLPLTDEANVMTAGGGEIITISDPSAVRDWAAVLRSVPADHIGDGEEFWGDVGLVQAAAGVGDDSAQALPWLLVALAAYIIIVGPVNVLVLRRLGRMSLMWITVPVISLITVGAIWSVGNSTGARRMAAHATTIVQAGDTARAHSAVVFSAGGEGTHTLGLPPSWLAAPYDYQGMFGPGSTTELTMTVAADGGVRLTMDLPSLGMGTADAAWEASPVGITATRTGRSYTIANHGDLTFATWGVGTAEEVGISFDELPSGGSGAVVPTTVGYFGGPPPVADMVMDALTSQMDGPGFGSGMDWERLGDIWYGVITDAQLRNPEAFEGTYFFGMTEDIRPTVEIDGTPTAAAGQTLVVVPLEIADENPQAIGRLVAVEGASFVQNEGSSVYASSPESLDVLFDLPAEATGGISVTISGGEVPDISDIDAYNWATGSFDTYTWPEMIPAAHHIASDGTLAVKIHFGTGGSGEPGRDMYLPQGGVRAAVVTP